MGWTGKKSIVRYTRLCKNIILILLMMNGEIFMMHSHCPKFIWMTQIPALAFTFMVLGFAIFFVAIMNYVLVAIATMSRRAKSIGVHKCSGASAINIFSMFLFETGIVVLMSVIVALFIIFNTKDLIEDLLSVQLSSLFTLETLWVPILIVFVLFIVAGVLPGRLFSRIPVTQVFRRYTDGKKGVEAFSFICTIYGGIFCDGDFVSIFDAVSSSD